MNSFKVIEDWILVLPEDEGEQVTKGGIVLLKKPEEDSVKRAVVVQISEDIEKNYLHYAVGDTILFYGKSGIPMKDNGITYKFMKYDGMLAIEDKKEE